MEVRAQRRAMVGGTGCREKTKKTTYAVECTGTAVVATGAFGLVLASRATGEGRSIYRLARSGDGREVGGGP